jgi:hypothetical protein
MQEDIRRLREAKQLIPMEFYTTRLDTLIPKFNLDIMLPPNNKQIPLFDFTAKVDSIEFNVPQQSQMTFIYNCYTKCEFKRLAVIFDEKDEDSNSEMEKKNILNKDTETFLDGLNRPDGSVTISISSATSKFGIELVGKTESGMGISILLTFFGTYMKLKLKIGDETPERYFTKYDDDSIPDFFLQRLRDSDCKEVTSVVLFYNYRISFSLQRGKFLTSVWSFQNKKNKKPLLAGFQTNYKCSSCKIDKIIIHSLSKDLEEVEKAQETKDNYEANV